VSKRDRQCAKQPSSTRTITSVGNVEAGEAHNSAIRVIDALDQIVTYRDSAHLSLTWTTVVTDEVGRRLNLAAP
jgi:hypothetical protein